jgi:hypothetical protein
MSTKPRRDLRLDVFRGLALFFIFVDHIPYNQLSAFTVQALGFFDAAEVFIFISGYTAALVYGRSYMRDGFLVATAQVYRRVWQLYVAHLFLFIVLSAIVSYVIQRAGSPPSSPSRTWRWCGPSPSSSSRPSSTSCRSTSCFSRSSRWS